ncbi:MAG: helix-turn-helix transcriptional regulator [Archaeoglobaceae archaeon]
MESTSRYNPVNRLSMEQIFLVSIILVSGAYIMWFLYCSLNGGGCHHIYSAQKGVTHFFLRLSFPVAIVLMVSLMMLKTKTKTKTRKQLNVSSQPVDSVYRVLLPDEQEIVRVLREKGSITQKDLSMETGFNKVKVHRLVYRLSEKNVVNIESAGKSNIISLSDWLVNEE